VKVISFFPNSICFALGFGCILSGLASTCIFVIDGVEKWFLYHDGSSIDWYHLLLNSIEITSWLPLGMWRRAASA